MHVCEGINTSSMPATSPDAASIANVQLDVLQVVMAQMRWLLFHVLSLMTKPLTPHVHAGLAKLLRC
jgi:hypothetical protein